MISFEEVLEKKNVFIMILFWNKHMLKYEAPSFILLVMTLTVTIMPVTWES